MLKPRQLIDSLSLSRHLLISTVKKKEREKREKKEQLSYQQVLLNLFCVLFYFLSLYCFLFFFSATSLTHKTKKTEEREKKSERKRPLDSTEKFAKAICVFIVSFCFLRYLYFLSLSDFLFSFFTLFPFLFLLVRFRMKKKKRKQALPGQLCVSPSHAKSSVVASCLSSTFF